MLLFRVGSVNTVSNVVTSESSSEWSWSIHLGLRRLSWSNNLSPPVNSIVTNYLHTSDYITWEERGNVREERFSLVFSIELLCSLLIEPRHLEFCNIESICVNSVDHFSCLGVNIWLNHSEWFLTGLIKFRSSENIAVVNKLELSIVNSYDRPNI